MNTKCPICMLKRTRYCPKNFEDDDEKCYLSREDMVANYFTMLKEIEKLEKKLDKKTIAKDKKK